jgi:aquaglyceroporin related protein
MKLGYMTNASCFFSEFLATAMLMIAILAGTDKRNTAPPAGLLPLVIFFVIFGIAAALGMETGAFLIVFYCL